MTDGQRLIVLESFKKPSDTTNPYIVMLLNGLRRKCQVMTFSWRRALSGRYDVFHVHWPEILLRSERLSRRIARRAAFSLLLVRLRSRRTPVVRTMHNLKPHEGVPLVDRWLLRRLDRLTTHWIRLNNQTPFSQDQDVTTIPLGHFRDWFPPAPNVSPDPNRLLFFGMIRPYKGIIDLVSAFEQTQKDEFHLVIIGKPNSVQLAESITQAAANNPRITLYLEHVDDGVLAQEIARASLIVLPYENLHNSAALLNALSLSRPALVPQTPTTEELAREVGPEWVYTYRGPISPMILENALDSVGNSELTTPDLSGRDWDAVASEHLAVFNRAVNS